jgi:hypothetical protein
VVLTLGILYDKWNIKARGQRAVWKITDLDYEAPLFANAEARLGTGFGQTLWAKHLHRGTFAPTREVKGGRGGQYAARDVFRMRIVYLLGEEVGIPPSEALQIANLATKGPWNVKELAAEPKNWRSFVIRELPPPLDVFLIFSKADDCWGYEILGPDNIKNSASVVLAAARELIAVSKYCWSILHAADRVDRTG